MGLASLPARLARKIANDRAHHELVRDMQTIVGAHPLGRSTTPGTGLRVGVATFGSGSWHLGLEVLLSHALALRGARPELLLCDLPDLPACDERTIFSRDIDRCAGCADDKRALLGVCGIPWRGVSALVPQDAVVRARSAVVGLEAGAIAAYRERGWPIGQWLYVSACHYLRCDAHGNTPEKIDTHRRLLASAIVIAGAVERWLDEAQPDIVIAESGAHFMWRIAMELARARGIPVVCREMGKGGWDQHLYSLNADCMSPDLDEPWLRAREEPLSAEEESSVEALLDALAAKAFVQTIALRARGADHVRATLGVPEGKKLAVAFTNVTWDLATSGRDVGFAGVFDWVRETVHVLGERADAHVIVRAHPAEASVQTREQILDQVVQVWPHGLPSLTLVGPEHSIAARDLYEAADLTLVYNSSAGIEAAARGRTVLVCGNPHYRGKGFTIDVASKTAYADQLSRWAVGDAVAAPVHASELARRYAHLFFLRYHVPMGWTTSPLEPPYRLTLRSIDELRPGHNPSLDVVCDSILARRQVLLPRRSA